ncbi:MAG: DUF3987 domain-containing protein [Candidatus Cloacimonadaceae bacterium]|nr:DUF3987 domain-containing protein [Candidatus Cloacimonadaceae bacterium]
MLSIQSDQAQTTLPAVVNNEPETQRQIASTETPSNERIADERLLLRVPSGPAINRPASLAVQPLADVIGRIKNGTYRIPVEALRAENDPAKRKQMKQSLPYFVYGIVRGSREDKNVTQANGIVLDFDGIADPEALKKSLSEAMFLRFAFLSPQGGVKALIPFSRPITSRSEYAAVWKFLRALFTEAVGIEADNTPDISRACFVSFDPDPVDLPDALPFDPDKYAEDVMDMSMKDAAEEKTETPDAVGEIPRHETPGAIGASRSDSARITDLPELYIELAVEHLAKAQISWREWTRCAMALHNHFGDAGKKYWLRFLDNPNYPGDTIAEYDAQWERIKRYTGVNIGTLFHIAGQHGWRHVIAPQSKDFGLEDYPDLLELFGKPQNVTLDRSRLPDFMVEYLDVVGRITDAQDGAKLTAMLPVIAANIGNRVHMSNAGTNHYCNIWAAIIGPSTVSRKSTVINQALKMIKPFKAALPDNAKERNEQDMEITRVTQARLFNLLAVNANRIILQMELASWMQEMNKNYNAGMKQDITDMFDGKDRSIAKVDIDEYIRRPAFSILGATTEDWFFRELREVADQKGGFLQRFVVCMIQNIDLEGLVFDCRDSRVPDDWLYEQDRKLAVFRDLEGTRRLDTDSEAAAFRNAAYAEKMKEAAISGNDTLASYCSRIYDNYWFRFCILIHCFQNWREIREAWEADAVNHWFYSHPVGVETAKAAWYL